MWKGKQKRENTHKYLKAVFEVKKGMGTGYWNGKLALILTSLPYNNFLILTFFVAYIANLERVK